MKKNHLTREEFVKEFARVLQFVKALKDGNTRNFSEILKRVEKAISSLETGNKDDVKRIKDESFKTISKYIAIASKEITLKFNQLDEKMASIKDGLDGRDGKDGFDGKDGSPDTREDIVKKINKGKEKDQKIKLSQIETFDKGITKDVLDRAISILDQRTQFLINKVSNLATVGVGGSAVYRNDGTISGTTITMTRNATTVLSLVIQGQFLHTFTHTSGSNEITITSDEAVGFNGNDYTVIFV